MFGRLEPFRPLFRSEGALQQALAIRGEGIAALRTG
jgi:hypothetical protein